MADRNTFVMYLEWKTQLDLLTDEECGRLVKGIFQYIQTGEDPTLSGAEMMAFSFIRAQIDRDYEKWSETCQRRAEAGKLGGRPKANGFSEKAKKPKGFSEKQSKAKKPDNEYDHEYDHDIYPPNPPTGELFEKFWASYPRKTAKRNALRAFEKLNVTEALLTEMLAALDWQRHSEQWTKDNGSYIPHPATWLNGRRWEDERPGTKTRTLTTENGETIKLYD